MPVQPNKSVNTDAQGRPHLWCSNSLFAGYVQRYAGVICSVPFFQLRRRFGVAPSSCLCEVGVRAGCAVLTSRTTAGAGRARNRRQSETLRPGQASLKQCAASGARACRPSQALRGCVGSKGSVAPRGLQRRPRYNKAVDTDVLSAGFRPPTVRRSLLR